ncbi:hypothetical protein PVNG_05998 [Plasmodium vivax North Korean]|uniref:VIR protein n=1 Tax=Plasmodium vivax North Korean TaxID=1035514 RepID=A0A0J9TLA5_PLAVI|nr:hypothetical protein PVNG_05998 [Plasmodium vivax North Korean]
MTSPNSNPKYIDYKHYGNIVSVYNEYSNLSDDTEEFQKITENINTQREKLKLPNKIFITLHKILRNSKGFLHNITDNYCSYVNYKLNDEVRVNHKHVDASNFDIFHKFVVNYNNKRHGRKRSTCYDYIEYLNDDIYRRMSTLYKFYSFYHDLNSSNPTVRDNACNNLPYYIYLYNDAINDFYDNDRNLFEKIRHVKDLAVTYTSIPTLACYKYANFHQAKGEQAEREAAQKREQEEREAAQKREQEEREAAQKREQAEIAAALKRKQEQDIEFTRGIYPMQKTNEELRARLSQGDSGTGVGLEDLRASRDLRGHEHSHVLSYPERSHNLGKLTEYRESSLSEQDEGQFEGVVSQSESEGTPKDSSFLSSLGIPRSITGVLGEIDPVPVVGVSGGMGALFLLFRVLKILNQ